MTDTKTPRRPGPGGARGQGGPRPHGQRRPAPDPRKAKKPAGPTARTVALKALQDVVRGDAYAAQALDKQLQTAKLSPEDRRLAASLFYFAVENRLYIETMLGKFLDAKPEPVVNDILHIAAAQLLFMDRVPDHAAVDEAVKQVRFAGRDGLTGLVNGVLRNLIRARDAGELTLPDRDANPVAWLSVKRSVAPVIAERLIDAYGLERAERLVTARPERGQAVRFNRMVTDAAAFAAWLDAHEYTWHPGLVEDAFIVENGGNLADTDGYRQGLFSIQGQSAMLAAQAVEAKPGMHILDACAAPGGKTALMAERMGGAGRVYAWDVHEHRVTLIRAAARRLGLDNVRATVYDAREPMESIRMTMDAVLVDAPCSGLGVLNEKPDIKYRATAESLDALPALQLQILESAAQAVKPGGRLVYATCTVLPQENGDVVNAFLKAHPEFAPDTRANWLPEALRGDLSDGMLTLSPEREDFEGFFIARMTRRQA